MSERRTEFDLVTIGNCCVDIFLPPHEPPPRGGLTLIPTLAVVPGGNGLNTAVTAARLGARTSIAGVLGADLFGRHLESVLSGEGVDTDLLRLLDARESPATIVVNDDTGERSFIHHPGTNADYQLPPAAFEATARVFHLAAPEILGSYWPDGCTETARRLRQRGATIAVDAFADRGGADVVKAHAPLLELCDIALPNEDEARLITGTETVEDAARAMHDAGVHIVAIKRGERGALLSVDGDRTEIPTDRVAAVDTCGAGDNFAGGFLAAFLRGKSPVECARVGCAMGTRCVAFRGSLTGTADVAFLEAMRARIA